MAARSGCAPWPTMRDSCTDPHRPCRDDHASARDRTHGTTYRPIPDGAASRRATQSLHRLRAPYARLRQIPVNLSPRSDAQHVQAGVVEAVDQAQSCNPRGTPWSRTTSRAMATSGCTQGIEENEFATPYPLVGSLHLGEFVR
jgi:hypothetical protein